MKRIIQKTKNKLRQVRHLRVRAQITGTADKPRLSVFRSLKSITAQLINDVKGVTLCQAGSHEVKAASVEGKKGKEAVAYLVGKLLAERAKEKKIETVVFDRGGYKYHGRVQSLADGARANGLKF